MQYGTPELYMIWLICLPRVCYDIYGVWGRLVRHFRHADIWLALTAIFFRSEGGSDISQGILIIIVLLESLRSWFIFHCGTDIRKWLLFECHRLLLQIYEIFLSPFFTGCLTPNRKNKFMTRLLFLKWVFQKKILKLN